MRQLTIKASAFMGDSTRPCFHCGILQDFGFGEKSKIECNIVKKNKFAEKLF